MLLSHALRSERKEVVALVGGGGKTTTMFRLARELSDRGLRVVTTTTTRIFVTQMAAAAHHLIAEDEDSLLAELANALDQDGHVLVVGGTRVEEDKALGVKPTLVESIAALPSVDAVIIEPDGARMRPLKAPAEHEPVIPACTTLVVPMAGVEAVGRPLNEQSAHRPERVAALSGACLGDPVTREMVAKVLAHPQGGRRGVPSGARVVPLLNKVQTAEELATARLIARLLLQEPAIDSVVIGAMEAEDPALEVRGRSVAIVLAAGGATRFGQPKVLLPWGQTTLLGRVVDLALAAQEIDEVIVVVGCERERAAAEVRNRQVRVVVNEAWAEGQSSSVRAGLAALPGNVGAVLFLLADQPGMRCEVIEALMQRHRQTLAPIVAPIYRGQRGNPVLFDRSVFPELGRLRGDAGGRRLIERLAGEVERLAFDVPPPYDIDTPADYQRFGP